MWVRAYEGKGQVRFWDWGEWSLVWCRGVPGSQQGHEGGFPDFEERGVSGVMEFEISEPVWSQEIGSLRYSGTGSLGWGIRSSQLMGEGSDRPRPKDP